MAKSRAGAASSPVHERLRVAIEDGPGVFGRVGARCVVRRLQSKLICFADEPVIAHCEIDAFRYAILHTAARLTRSARALHLRLDRSWAWSEVLATAFSLLRAAFG